MIICLLFTGLSTTKHRFMFAIAEMELFKQISNVSSRGGWVDGDYCTPKRGWKTDFWRCQLDFRKKADTTGDLLNQSKIHVIHFPTVRHVCIGRPFLLAYGSGHSLFTRFLLIFNPLCSRLVNPTQGGLGMIPFRDCMNFAILACVYCLPFESTEGRDRIGCSTLAHCCQRKTDAPVWRDLFA